MRSSQKMRITFNHKKKKRCSFSHADAHISLLTPSPTSCKCDACTLRVCKKSAAGATVAGNELSRDQPEFWDPMAAWQHLKPENTHNGWPESLWQFQHKKVQWKKKEEQGLLGEEVICVCEREVSHKPTCWSKTTCCSQDGHEQPDHQCGHYM